MNQSFPKSYAVPGTLSTGAGNLPRRQPAFIAQAAEVMRRVLVRNLDPDHPVFLSVEEQALTPEIQSDVYELPGGDADVFPLAPGQKLYARAANGVTTGRVSVFTSDAFPIEIGGV